ncbi:hypothetical protein Tco_0072698 [Tanacetum coccineum]
MELSSCVIKDEKDFEGGSTATCVSVMESKVQILLWLLDPRMDDDSQLIKGNAERTSSFVVLVSLLKPLHPSSTIYEVDLDSILQSIHQTYRVGVRGTAIKGQLSMVPIDMEPQPIILAYIDVNLQTLAAARMLTTTGPTGQ